MIILGNLLIAVAQALGMLISLYTWIVIARCILSFVSPDPRNPIVQFIYNATEPVLAKVRSKIPPLGMFDLSPIVVFLALSFINAFFVESLMMYGEQIRRAV